MAITFDHLWPRVVAWENLLLAYTQARRGKRARPDVARFEAHREQELLLLRDELRSGSWTPGGYRHFTIRRPKERVISAAPFRDRVVHHAVVHVIEPLFERRFSFDSYACRVGKGTHRAVCRAARFLRSRAFVLQADVRKFFPSIDHEVLLGVVGRTVRDERVLDLLRRILASGVGIPGGEGPPVYDLSDPAPLFAPLRPRGLPIGNLTSQFLANVLLDVLDHEVSERIGCRGYVRYCDDFLVFDDDRDRLRATRAAIESLLRRLRLEVHPNETFVKPTSVGVDFLGYRIRREGIRLLPASISRANARLGVQARALRAGHAARGDVRASVVSWRAHTLHANATALRETLLARHRLAGLVS